MKNKENNRVIAAAGVVGKQISLIIIAVIIATLFLAGKKVFHRAYIQ